MPGDKISIFFGVLGAVLTVLGNFVAIATYVHHRRTQTSISPLISPDHGPVMPSDFDLVELPLRQGYLLGQYADLPERSDRVSVWVKEETFGWIGAEESRLLRKRMKKGKGI